MNYDLGLGMIVKNEAEVLATCLRSVHGLFDRIVIVDTGSTDGTQEIARSFGAEVIPFEWVDTYRPNWDFGFSAARNFCWDHLPTYWRMWLDADDILIGREHFDDMMQKLEAKPGLEGVILEYLYSFTTAGEQQLDQLTPSIVDKQFSFDEIMHVLKPVCITTHHRERIVLNHPSLRFKYPIHEAVSTVGHWFGRYDKVKIVHRRHVKQGAQSVNERNWRLLRQIPEQERDERIWFYLGLEQAQRNEIEDSIHSFEKYLSLATIDDEKYFAIHYLADLHRKKSLWDRSIEYDLRAVAMHPTWRDAYAGLLASSVAQEDWKQALYYGARCAQAEIPDTPFAYNPFVEEVGWVTGYVMALAHFGLMEEALKETTRALEFLPQDPGLLHNADLFYSELNLRRGIDERLSFRLERRRIDGEHEQVDVDRRDHVLHDH